MFSDKLKHFYSVFVEVCRSAGRKPEEIEIVFATKYIDGRQLAAFIPQAAAFVPHVLIGENRVQDAEEKLTYLKEHHPELEGTFTPILIGTLQKNKMNKAVELFEEIQSVDSISHAIALNERLKRFGKRMPVFVEVNVAEEETKEGFWEDEFIDAYEELKTLEAIHIKGLMTMAPIEEDPEKTTPVFRALRVLANSYNLQTSMGMSNDWTVAIKEGTDMIRVGSILFH